MFKQYIQAGTQNNTAATQGTTGVDLMIITTYTFNPGNNYVSLIGPGLNVQVYMDRPTFEEFQTNLKTANRLKRALE